MDQQKLHDQQALFQQNEGIYRPTTAGSYIASPAPTYVTAAYGQSPSLSNFSPAISNFSPVQPIANTQTSMAVPLVEMDGKEIGKQPSVELAELDGGDLSIGKRSGSHKGSPPKSKWSMLRRGSGE